MEDVRRNGTISHGTVCGERSHRWHFAATRSETRWHRFESPYRFPFRTSQFPCPELSVYRHQDHQDEGTYRHKIRRSFTDSEEVPFPVDAQDSVLQDAKRLTCYGHQESGGARRRLALVTLPMSCARGDRECQPPTLTAPDPMRRTSVIAEEPTSSSVASRSALLLRR